MQKPHRRRGASTQAMQTQLLLLLRKGCQSNIRTTSHTKSYRCCLNIVKMFPAWSASPLHHRQMALRFTGGKLGYHGGAYIDISDELLFFFFFYASFQTGRVIIEMLLGAFFFWSKKGVPSSSCRSSSREPGGQTDPKSCRTPDGSLQVIDVSGNAKHSRGKILT